MIETKQKIENKMEPVSQNGEDDRIVKILDMIGGLANFDAFARLNSGKGDELDVIMAGLRGIEDQKKVRQLGDQNKEKRINEIIELLLRYTIKDFSQRVAISDKGDELDAVAVGLNTLVEELEYSLTSERKKTKEIAETNSLLKESEERIKAIFSSAPDAVIVIYSDGIVQRWNEKAEEMFGWCEDEVLNSPLFDYIMPQENHAAEQKKMESFIKNPKADSKTLDIKVIDKKGRPFDASLSVSSSRRKGEQVFICFFRDVTESKKMQEALRQSEERYHSLVDEIVDYAVIRLDPTGKITTWNKGAEKIKGYSEEEIIGKDFSIFYTPEDIEKGVPQTVIETALKEGRYTFSGWRVRKDKTLFWADIAISRINDKNGKLLGYVKVTRDLTRQKLAEDDLKASQNFLNSIIENLPNMLFVKDAKNLRFVRLNKAGEELLGYSRDEFIGKSDFDFFPKEEADFFTSKDKEVLASGKLGQVEEETIRTKNNGIRILETKKIPILSLEGEPKYLLGISNDITERKKNEMELVEKTAELKRSNEELEQFAYVASHDLQEPLRMVTSYLQLLENRYKSKLDEDAVDFINFAVDGATRMRSLINSLLEYSRLNRAKPFEHVDLNEVMEEILKDLKNQIAENKVTIHYDKLPVIWADAVLMGQLLFNLILNAIKFKAEKDPVITISSKKGKGEILFCVEDNGIGISSEYFDKIFIIFQKLHSREKYPGTGIGLAVCKKIVERHGGSIWVESEPRKGAKFYFTIKENLTAPILNTKY